MKTAPAIFLIIVTILISTAYAVEKEYKHSERGLSCADCHRTDNPLTKASQAACKDCHGEMTDAAPVKFSEKGKAYELNIHNSHAGVMRCTLCHSEHSRSTVYCNEGCHHGFNLAAP